MHKQETFKTRDLDVSESSEFNFNVDYKSFRKKSRLRRLSSDDFLQSSFVDTKKIE